MLVRLGLLVWLALAPQRTPAPPDALAPHAVRQKLRGTVGEVAKTGQAELVRRMTDVLAALGEEPEELERLAPSWEKSAANARPSRSTAPAAAGKLRRELAPLVDELAGAAEPRRSELARWILELDSDQPEANAVLGRERSEDGAWLSREERTWRDGAARQAGLLRLAGVLDFEARHGASQNPALVKLGGGNVARARGITLHGDVAPERLERILCQVLRAAALSSALLRGELEVPEELQAREFVLLDSEERFAEAVEEAREARSVAPEDVQALEALRLHSFLDARGWRTTRWRTEAELAALILWASIGDWLDRAQPCLRVGHLNWLSLSFLGSAMPMAIWQETIAGSAAATTSAKRDPELERQVLWRCARQSLSGCRAWMVAQVRERRDAPWVRAMVDQDGKIADENLLKTTLACEMLQQEGRLGPLIEATRRKPPSPATIEGALGEPLVELEARWRRWLVPQRRPGVLQELQSGGPGPPVEDRFATALLALNRARVNALKDQEPEIDIVVLDPDLCRGAEQHARYLARNPAQKGAWPAMHEEYAGAPGFTPEGSLAAARSVIASGNDPVQAVESWLGTFFHRLPLLHPGLFGVGFAVSEDVVVLDAGALVVSPWKDHVVVWPLPGAENVRRDCVPEMPSPVPGADLAGLGMPISVQLFFRDRSSATSLELELFVGDPTAGRAVDCHSITPEAPLQPELAPENAWGLIPKDVLARETRYTARARWLDQERVWSFTTGR